MTPALVFTYSGAAAHAPGAPPRGARDGILYRNAEAALALAGTVDARGAAPAVPPAATSPGLLRLGSDEKLLAVGLDAHLALADCQKCTLLAETLDLEAFGAAARPDHEAINGLLWSCLNTRRAVAVGRRAWSAAQLLPFADLRFHPTPPLRWTAAGAAGAAPDPQKILVIDHETGGTTAAELQAALGSYARVEVVRGWTIVGQGPADGQGPMDGQKLMDGQRPVDMADLDAGLHIHVGDHTMASDALRLVDSWINRIPALHVRSRRGAPPLARDEDAGGEQPLRVRHAQNGFECAGVGEVLAACEDLRNDRVLRAKVTESGARTVAPLADGWKAIAAELLDG